jgi:hypothetical protein
VARQDTSTNLRKQAYGVLKRADSSDHSEEIRLDELLLSEARGKRDANPSSRVFGPTALMSAVRRLGGKGNLASNHWTEDRAMPLTTEEKLLALSRETIEVFDKVNGGLHRGFRPAHAKGILMTGMFTPSSEAASLTRAPHLRRDSTPVTVRSRILREFRASLITTRRAPALAGLRFASTSASMFTPTSSVIRSTTSRRAPRRDS